MNPPALATHGSGAPSAWVQRWLHLVPPGGQVLDLACGSGRHVRWLAAQGFSVTGVDRDAAALAGLQQTLAAQGQQAELLEADLENGPWPLAGRRFDAVVVTNYLWRPTVPQVLALLKPGALYLHETFADGQQHIGRPSRPEFLLQRGELLRWCQGLQTVAFEDGWLDGPPRCVQRIAALNPVSADPGAAAKIAVSPNLGSP
ncbi:MAG: class I SAM-dependent methyltransferase [Rubrivivax sp.]